MKPTIEDLKKDLMTQYTKDLEDFNEMRGVLKEMLERMLNYAFDVAYDRGWSDCEESVEIK